MAVIQLPQKQDDFMPALLQLFQQMEERKRGKATLAQQQSQFEQTHALNKGLTDAQIAQANASAGYSGAQTVKTNWEVASNRAKERAMPVMNDIKQMREQGATPIEISTHTNRVLAEMGQDRETQGLVAESVRDLLSGNLYARPGLPIDAANRSQAQRDADITARVTAGGQNPMDVDYANQRAGRAAMSAPGFDYQDTAEQGPAAVKSAVAIGDKRAESADNAADNVTSRANQSSSNATQLQIAKEGDANERTIAGMKAAGATGTTPEKEQMRLDTATLIRNLVGHPGRTGATGMKNASSLYGILDAPIAGTDEASFVGKLNTAKARLTLDNLILLKGAISDKDILFLNAIPAALERGLGDDEFKGELERILQKLDGTPDDDPMGLFKSIK